MLQFVNRSLARKLIYPAVKIFFSYASEDREQARAIYHALRDQGHTVFFDRTDLPAGEEFHNHIRTAIEASHLFIFLLTIKAIDAGSYTLTELEIAQKSGIRVLPIVPDAIDFALIPTALKSVTFLQPDGNVAASVAAETARIARAWRRRRVKQIVTGVTLVAAFSIGLFYGQKFFTKRGFIGNDGAPTVLVPAGTFVMGDDDQSPRREIFLNAFYIDVFEVTLARYANFLKATGNMRAPENWPNGEVARNGDLPVVGVDWYDAEAYCHWAGKRLLTDAEWEKAARGSDERTYPWGNDEPTPDRARFGLPYERLAYQNGVAAVGTHPKGTSIFGVQDLAGNVSEWVNDWFAESFPLSERRNPKGPKIGTDKVIRGGGWFDPASYITAARRMYANPDNRADDVGFRCAADAR
ncbi:SUMF1/EgtB/PvdO family nonheme iron enzyme [Nitrosomonas communis]|uniref:SUMF1/EgtB/PvdO family nonheme iron enzyme n=1 Tax=Nitrosomonas communis TaxID=44574 RepID=UPI000AEDC906|nr:SUMF1/EgtB/PvdO family nonheme iron enzyme [Nitrosomonas communis]